MPLCQYTMIFKDSKSLSTSNIKNLECLQAQWQHINNTGAQIRNNSASEHSLHLKVLFWTRQHLCTHAAYITGCLWVRFQIRGLSSKFFSKKTTLQNMHQLSNDPHQGLYIIMCALLVVVKS